MNSCRVPFVTGRTIRPTRRGLLMGAIAAAAGTMWDSLPLPAAESATPRTQLWIGAASADITPPKLPVALTGFQSVRLTRTVQSPLTVNALALESRQGSPGGPDGRLLDQAILVSCDLCVIRPGMQDEFRTRVAPRLPGFDVKKLFLAATHTHSAPVVEPGLYDDSQFGDAMRPREYVPFLYDRMAEAVVKAWEGRAVGAMGRGLGHAVVGHNRRVVYADGHAQMLGETNDPQFRHVEGYEDHAVDILCFYDQRRRLKATALAVACTAQMSQGETVVSADFWHDAREHLRRRYGKDLVMLGFCAPAGDQCPHLSYRKRSEARMDRLRGLSRTQELGRRIAQAFFDSAEAIAKDVRDDVPLAHLVRQVDLPTRIVKDSEYAVAKKVVADIDAKKDRGPWDAWVRTLYASICQRYLDQQSGKKRVYAMELHALRLGDAAIATSPFELFLDYGVQIEARSAAEQTILIQLAGTSREDGYYVPTPRAMAGGGLTEAPMNNYSATVMTDVIGPEGAQALVDRTVEAIGSMWKPAAK